jgi:hypothetical protein
MLLGGWGSRSVTLLLLCSCTKLDPLSMAVPASSVRNAAGAASPPSAGASAPRAGHRAAPAAGTSSSPSPPGPVTRSLMGMTCEEEGAKGCAQPDGMRSLLCRDGRWQDAGACARTERCDSLPGPTFGSCQPMIGLCLGKQEGDAVCDGWTRRRCGTDLLRFSEDSCPANAHCEQRGGVLCSCDLNHVDDGTGNCVRSVVCPTNACMPGGRCVVGESDYSCECGPEHAGTGTKECTAIGPCAAATVCSDDYVCRSRAMGYTCRGQLADWPMPSLAPGAKAAPSYMVGERTVSDTVTGLVWQRAVGPSEGNDPSSCTGGCDWNEARIYCEGLALEGMSGWRLPGLIELVSILDDTRVEPSIDVMAFPDTPLATFWTAGTSAERADQAWAVGFATFQVLSVAKTSEQRVRCVRDAGMAP